MIERLKSLFYECLRTIGYEITPIVLHQFILGDLHFECHPCSTGLLPESETAAKGAVQLIEQRCSGSDLQILDLCCGVGIIGCWLLNHYHKHQRKISVTFADINLFSIDSVKYNLRKNKLDRFSPSVFLSDGLKNIPDDRKFDVIVCNPPHHFSGTDVSAIQTPFSLSAFDPDWNFHQSFYQICHRYLSSRGEVWFFENRHAGGQEKFMEFISQNDNIDFISSNTEPLDEKYYWMISKKVK